MISTSSRKRRYAPDPGRPDVIVSPPCDTQGGLGTTRVGGGDTQTPVQVGVCGGEGGGGWGGVSPPPFPP